VKYWVVIGQLPQLIIGRIILAFLRKRIVSTELRGIATVHRYRPWKLLWGVSLGPTIILADHPAHDETTVRHEYGHSLQSMKLGPLYLIAVGIPSFIRATLWYVTKLPKDLYYRGYPEDWADRLGGVERAPT
jgi:hypothetical protein